MSWNDVGGLEDVKRELQETVQVQYVQYAKLFACALAAVNVVQFPDSALRVVSVQACMDPLSETRNSRTAAEVGVALPFLRDFHFRFQSSLGDLPPP